MDGTRGKGCGNVTLSGNRSISCMDGRAVEMRD